MLVSCPKCESRYKLPDEKIRATGTKVRCPRCQHTFKVFSDSPAPAEIPKKPETPAHVQKSPPSLSQDLPPLRAEKKSAPPVDENFEAESDSTRTEAADYFEGAKTMVSPPSKKTDSKEKEPSPFKRGRTSSAHFKSVGSINEATELDKRILQKESSYKVAEESEPGSESESEEKAPLRPFGDATFAEIQVRGRNKKNKKWISVALGVVVVAALSFLIFNSFKSHRSIESSASKVTPVIATATVKKSNGWYKDDPSFYQDFLSQMAALPLEEQQKPENRALIADALISNGMMNGADDQIISGIGFASGLIAAYPTASYGFLGLSSYAIWKEDLSTLGDLVKRWPADTQSSLEYRFSKAVVDSRSQTFRAGLDEMKKIIDEQPDLFRAQAWILLLALDHTKDAEQVFAGHKLQEFSKIYQKRRAGFRNGSPVPTLFQSIDKRLSKKGSNFADTPAVKKDGAHEELVKEPVSAPVAKAKAEPKTQVADQTAELNNRAAQKFAQKKNELNKNGTVKESKKELRKKAKAAALAEKAKKVLPKADPELIALNKQSSKTKVEGQKLYEQGNQKQKENKVDEAIALYQSALRSDPDLAEVYKQLGIIYMNRQERERSLRAFKIYLQLKPESEDRQVVQGWISSMQ
ncbi:MAG: hypothetical protein JWQ35_782 [Bacteriovoracaceae bacterium]|nr:hypothetical protein [Bacteriovoracaceae bacterium]